MIWMVDDFEVTPGVFLAGGALLLVLGVSAIRDFYREVELSIRPPVALADGHEHLDAWITVSGIRFDCTQTFNFRSSDGKSVTSYVLATSEDGSVAAIARTRGTLDCPSLPTSPIKGKLWVLHGNNHLAQMRRSGLQIPLTKDPTLAFEMDLTPDESWFSLVTGAIALLLGTRAIRSGLRGRKAENTA